MKLLAFAASNSATSINSALAGYAAKRFVEANPDTTVETLNLDDYEVAIYSPAREAESGVPAKALALREKIGAADALIVSFAEHNGSTTAAWKNLFDWMSRAGQDVWQNVPMVLLAASPGPRAGAGVLGGQEAMAPFFGGNVKAVEGFGTWGDSWNAESSTLTSPEDEARLRAALSKLNA